MSQVLAQPVKPPSKGKIFAGRVKNMVTMFKTIVRMSKMLSGLGKGSYISFAFQNGAYNVDKVLLTRFVVGYTSALRELVKLFRVSRKRTALTPDEKLALPSKLKGVFSIVQAGGALKAFINTPIGADLEGNQLAPFGSDAIAGPDGSIVLDGDANTDIRRQLSASLREGGYGMRDSFALMMYLHVYALGLQKDASNMSFIEPSAAMNDTFGGIAAEFAYAPGTKDTKVAQGTSTTGTGYTTYGALIAHKGAKFNPAKFKMYNFQSFLALTVIPKDATAIKLASLPDGGAQIRADAINDHAMLKNAASVWAGSFAEDRKERQKARRAIKAAEKKAAKAAAKARSP